MSPQATRLHWKSRTGGPMGSPSNTRNTKNTRNTQVTRNRLVFLVFLVFLPFSLLFPQDKMLPQSPPVAPQPRAWDIRYRDLEPQLELQLADAPNSLEI